jgi:hypothetical protein
MVIESTSSMSSGNIEHARGRKSYQTLGVWCLDLQTGLRRNISLSLSCGGAA